MPHKVIKKEMSVKGKEGSKGKEKYREIPMPIPTGHHKSQRERSSKKMSDKPNITLLYSTLGCVYNIGHITWITAGIQELLLLVKRGDEE